MILNVANNDPVGDLPVSKRQYPPIRRIFLLHSLRWASTDFNNLLRLSPYSVTAMKKYGSAMALNHGAYSQAFGALLGQMFSGGSPLDHCRLAIVFALCAAPIAADLSNFF